MTTPDLLQAATDLAEAYRDLRVLPKSADNQQRTVEMIEFLRQRCPGFTEAEYRDAWAKGLARTR